MQPRPVLVQPEDESVRLIGLTQGQVAIVDANRFEWASQWHWYAQQMPSTRGFYARRNGRTGEPRTAYFLHRQLVGEPKGEVDHKNGDSLDCRISNLRACTHAQNLANKKPAPRNISGYPGVSWEKNVHKWRARIKVRGRRIPLGFFENLGDAINARQIAERQHFGEYAYSARQARQHHAA